MDQFDLINVYRTLLLTIAENTFFSSVHGAFTKDRSYLGHKANLNKIIKIQISHSVFSDHNGIKLEINDRKTPGQSSNIWKLNNIFLNNL